MKMRFGRSSLCWNAVSYWRTASERNAMRRSPGEHLPIEEEKRIQSHIDVFTDIRSEVDAVFLQDYKDLSLLFENKKKRESHSFSQLFHQLSGYGGNRLEAAAAVGCAGSARKPPLSDPCVYQQFR